MPNQDGPLVFVTVCCFLPAVFTVNTLYGYAKSEDPHHSLLSYLRIKYTGAGDIPNVPIHPQYSNIYYKRLPSQAALFLFNSTMPHHIEFMHDVRVANWRHDVSIFKHDCTKHSSICGSLGHGNVHEYEPPILYLHDGEWSESYHDDIQQDKVPRPKTRTERVDSVLRWLDKAAPGAPDKLREREMMLNRMREQGSPTQRYMEEMRKKEESKGKKKAKAEL